jgi:NAD(P)-dependent dehydrogenase (short-subunit alcohol dehydrogenase family)
VLSLLNPGFSSPQRNGKIGICSILDRLPRERTCGEEKRDARERTNNSRDPERVLIATGVRTDALEDVPIAEGRRQMEVNLIGVARLVQLSLPYMRAQKFGKIVNISTIGGKCATPLGGWYHASKFALEGYSDSLRMEVQPFGIDVIVIEPGGIDTEWAPIAIGSAQQYSGQGAYGAFVASMLKSPTLRRKMPPPKIITDLLLKALKSKRPRTRYHGGEMASLILFLKRVLPDRMLDRLIVKAMQ